VPLTVQVGLLLALATAFASVVGFLYKHRGAVESPPVEWRHPVATSLALFRSRWYVLGIVVAMGSWGFHVAALALAPISLVQSVIAGGLVLLTVVADRLFGFRVTGREWVGVGLTALGLAFLAATLEGTAGSSHNDYSPATLAAYVGLMCGAGLVVASLAWGRAGGGFPLGIAAGLVWAGSDVSIKALTASLDSGLGVLLEPLAAVIALASLVGLVISARSLQDGEAVPVIAGTSAAANLFTIVAGPVVFGEPLPDDPLALSLRLLAFVLVIAACALTPAPVRAASMKPAQAST
jgi:hypothetical protein